MTEAFAVSVTVNGQTYERRVEGRRLLVDFIRHDLGLYGTHVGCEQGVCGMCTVQLNGAPVKSCLMLAPQAHGQCITTVESLAERDELHPLQAAFREAHGLAVRLLHTGIPDDRTGAPRPRARSRPRGAS